MAKKPITPPGNVSARPARPIPPPLQTLMRRQGGVIANSSPPRETDQAVVRKVRDRKKD